MDHEELYRHASGVDISKNHQENEEMRAIGYDGEFEVFCALMDHFLDENIKVLMNVNVPTGYGTKSTEIDCLLICKTGLVSFECKNFKGTIYGNPEEENWTQYFRTAKNQPFLNPLKQNEYHIQALQRLYPGVPCYSVVVFTNPNCDASRVTFQERQSTVSTEFCVSERDLSDALQHILNRPVVLEDAGIDKLFAELSKYAAHYTSPPTKGDKITSLDTLLAEAREQIERMKLDMQKATRQAVESASRSKKKAAALALALTTVITSAVGIYAKNRIDWYSGQYQEMYEKFQQVSKDDFDIDLDIFCIENFSFEKSDVFNANELLFSIGLTQPSVNQGSCVEFKQAKLMVQLKNGDALEYSVQENSEVLRHISRLTWYDYKDNSELAVFGAFLIEQDLSEISYIKILNLVFYKDATESLYNEGHEIELTVYQS